MPQPTTFRLQKSALTSRQAPTNHIGCAIPVELMYEHSMPQSQVLLPNEAEQCVVFKKQNNIYIYVLIDHIKSYQIMTVGFHVKFIPMVGLILICRLLRRSKMWHLGRGSKQPLRRCNQAPKPTPKYSLRRGLEPQGFLIMLFTYKYINI